VKVRGGEKGRLERKPCNLKELYFVKFCRLVA